jgi:RHS repeat-associated protein
VAETDGSSGAVQASYALGNGALLAEIRAGTTSYTLPDGQGSVRALSSGSGNITDTYRYTAFGNVESSQGTTVSSYGYDGQRYDSQTNMYQLRARSYDPTIGRFLSRDPVAATIANPAELDRYAYAQDNPVNYADPSGRASVALPGPVAGSGSVAGTQQRGWGGALGEYVSLVLFVALQIARVAAVGAGALCLYAYADSIVFAWNFDAAGLLDLYALDPAEPPTCHIPILLYTPLVTKHIAAHIYDA